MAKNKITQNKDELLKAKDQEIKLLKEEIAKTKVLKKKIEEGEAAQKEHRKFDVKAWLIASSFAICSCLLGVTNLILNLVKR